MIELKNVVKIYETPDNNVHAVKNVSLTVEDSQIFGIVGSSGAGKSTLIRLINGLETPTSGNVYIDGEDIAKFNNEQLRNKRKKIGMIFQHFNLLWSSTVSQNIELPLIINGVPKEQRKKRVNELISLVGLLGKENQYPSALSGGQKQRVGIARALANNPSILLCDEATSALDPETTDSILELLKDINKKLGLTIVMITHQMEVVLKICHEMAVMYNGEIVERGKVKDLFEQPKHKITKKFVQNVEIGQSLEQVTKELKELYPFGILLRLNFIGELSNKPILAETIKQVEFPVNIVGANIKHGQSGPMGAMYIHISKAGEDEYKIFIDKLKEQGVKVEVL